MTTPTLINLPPPPSNPETPSDMGPGTPNSGTTSLSALSTTAIKDGHRGHPSAHVQPPGATPLASSASSSTLDAERADRISRLAGLERVAAVRSSSLSSSTAANPSVTQPPGYFDPTNPQAKERSTVGSASATGSVGGRTTWASSSDFNEADKMSEDGVSSTGGLSEEGNASLVGFGEGASSTISGPISTAANRAPLWSSGVSSPSATRGPIVPPFAVPQPPSGTDVTSSSVASTPTAGSTSADLRRDPQLIDGMTYDADVVDTAARPPPPLPADAGNHPSSAADTLLRDRPAAHGTSDLMRESIHSSARYPGEEP